MIAKAKPMQSSLLRLVLDLGPLLTFFVAYQFVGIYGATAIFMVAVIVALALDYFLERRLSPVPTFTAVLVLVFGGLTILLKNDTFIKIKPSVLYGFFGLSLLGGLAFGRLFIKYVFGRVFDLTETGWRLLTWRWGIFFLCLAVLNALVWLNFSEPVWVATKTWVFMPLIFLFALAQTPLVLKHENSQDRELDGKI